MRWKFVRCAAYDYLHPVTGEKMNADTGVSSTVEQERKIVFERLTGYGYKLNTVAANVTLAADGSRCAVLRQREVGSDRPRDAVWTCAVGAAAAH